MNFWKHKCLCNVINKTNNMARLVNHCVKHCQMSIIVCMLFHHLVELLPLVGWLSFKELFVIWCAYHHWWVFRQLKDFMPCGELLPVVGFLSAREFAAIERFSTSDRFSTIAGFSIIDRSSTHDGLSTIDGFSTTNGFSDINEFSAAGGAFCRRGLYHWWDFSW